MLESQVRTAVNTSIHNVTWGTVSGGNTYDIRRYIGQFDAILNRHGDCSVCLDGNMLRVCSVDPTHNQLAAAYSSGFNSERVLLQNSMRDDICARLINCLQADEDRVVSIGPDAIVVSGPGGQLDTIYHSQIALVGSIARATGKKSMVFNKHGSTYFGNKESDTSHLFAFLNKSRDDMHLDMDSDVAGTVFYLENEEDDQVLTTRTAFVDGHCMTESMPSSRALLAYAMGVLKVTITRGGLGFEVDDAAIERQENIMRSLDICQMYAPHVMISQIMASV